MNKNTRQIAIPFISVILGIILGAIIMWIFGYDALWGYEELFKTAFGSIKNVCGGSRSPTRRWSGL